MNQLYDEINVYNRDIIDSNWLGKMIFGSDRIYQTQTIDKFLEEIKRSLYKSKIPKSNIPNVIHETIEILGDHTGNTLLKYLKQSFGDRDYDKKEVLSFDEIEEKRMEDVLVFVDQCKKVFEKWPTMHESVYDDPSIPQDQQASSSDHIQEIDGIKGSRDLIFELLKAGANRKQLASYKRFVLLIQINSFMRSKGISLHQKSAEVNHHFILKDAQDIIVFSAPILWPKRIMNWIEHDTSPSSPPFPNNLARMATISIYKRFFSYSFDELLSLRIINREMIAKTSIDEVLNTCRRFTMTVICNVHPWIRY